MTSCWTSASLVGGREDADGRSEVYWDVLEPPAVD